MKTTDPDSDPIEVVCTCCGTLFRGFAPGQAEGCAAELRGHIVVGAPGSRNLPKSWARFNPEAQHGFEDGPICDSCIAAFYRDGFFRSRPNLDLVHSVPKEP